MDLLDLLPPEHIVVPLDAPDLRSAIEALLTRLEEAGAVKATPELHRRIRTEPLRDLVAITPEAVLPHYRSDAVDTLTLAVGVAPEPILPGESGIETQPRLVALILAPQEAAAFYLQTTSTLARLLRRPGLVSAIAEKASAAAIIAMPELQGLRIQPSLTVRDVMTHRIHAVPPSTTVRQVLDIMLRHRLHAVPIVGEKGEVLGMVTEGDLMRALLPKIPRAGAEEPDTDLEPSDRPVREIMARSVLCVSDDLGLSEVANMMINKDVEEIPVVNAGVITGMVSRSNIIRKLFGRI